MTCLVISTFLVVTIAQWKSALFYDTRSVNIHIWGVKLSICVSQLEVFIKFSGSLHCF
jgi:hypothetical protein